MAPSDWKELSPYNSLVNTGTMEPRAYQINIIKSVFTGSNTLVILPTGLGKTLIAVFAIAKALHEGRKALILAPTKPLSEQHFDSVKKLLNIDPNYAVLLTGSTGSKKRKDMERDGKVAVATPQTVANDIKSGRMSLDGYGVVIFDECHKAVGRYAYTYVANECTENGIQIVGLTASPGSGSKKIKALVDALGIQNIEIRVSNDSDVAPYVMGKRTNTIYLDMGDTINRIAYLVKPAINEHLSNLYSHGLSPYVDFETMPRGRLIEIGRSIDRIEAQKFKFINLFDYTYVLYLSHAYDLLTTEGIYPFTAYMKSLQEKEKKSRALSSILANKSIAEAVKLANDALESDEEHPKAVRIVEMVTRQLSGKSVIIFAQYRSTIKRLVQMLRTNGVNAMPFVGKKEGVTNADQRDTVEKFRKGEFKVLVATSIGEEGLDIPAVDAVIFYDPVPSVIRNIQRKGRAGRMKFGEIYIMVTRKTRDEKYLLISGMREKRMKENVEIIREQLARGTRRPTSGSADGQKRLF